MSKGNVFEGDIIALIFNATPIANLADNAGTSPLTDLRVGLSTADVGEAGDQTTNEATYTGYNRKLQARTSGGWTCTGNAAENATAIVFDQCTAGSNTISHFHIGSATSGAGKVFYKGALGASLAVSAGITPEFAAGALDVTED